MFEYIFFFTVISIPIVLVIIFKPEPEELTYNPEILKCESPIERRLFNGLISRGHNPASQWPEGRYRIDLALIGARIAIECDGKAFHSTPEQKAHDRKKNRYLRSRGWTVLRFSGSKIHRDLYGCVKQVEEILKRKL